MNHIRKFSALILISGTLVGATPSFAFQGSQEDQNACRGDVMNICSSAIGSIFSPNVPAITACLKAHMKQLSPACRAVMSRPAGKR